ncbi:hypothetical protein JDV02_002414 [Purpureocillium takamizusanense]|uniref:Zn(2)-C6 fungal-type domain-containing protein n=1 Tax=Purpureocillium takamizusanense TaxID=2060973 RepID=A0A9Q8QA85_9HYPO|nr:uncharacterized protein JDV02_002414 [Purpureocillium takamizusanense]UNI15930.1 hypothetical protein JDV02_002414 [Purpureocillium takamizusanense]
MPRKGIVKVRTGCITCKARRVKCDEGRPTCLVCQKAGKLCRGYAPPPIGYYSWEELLLLSKPVQTGLSNFPGVTALELRNIAFFQRVVAPSVCGPVTHSLWTRAISQVLHVEPAARHAVVALGSLYENSERVLRSDPMATGPLDAHRHAITHYNIAIRHLTTPRVYLANDTILLVCVLFIAIEFLRGNVEAAATHIRNGISLLNSVGSDDEDLVFALLHLAIFPFYFAMGPASDLEVPLGWDPSGLPHMFSSPSHAQAWLDLLSLRTVRLVRQAKENRSGVAAAVPLEEITAAAQCLDQDLDVWWSTFCMSRQGMQGDHTIMEKLLEARFLHAKMRISTNLDHDEHVWATQEQRFRRFVAVAQEVRHAWQSDDSKHRTFAFGMGFCPLLFRTVHKCRVLKLRLAALSLMDELCWARETVWDRTLLRALGEKIVEVEHGMRLTPERVKALQEEGSHELAVSADASLIRDIVLHPGPDLAMNADGSRIWKRRVTLILAGPGGSSEERLEECFEMR